MTRATVVASMRALWNDDAAPTAVEYAIMAGGIAAVIVAAVGVLGRGTVALFERVVSSWP